MKTTLCIFLIFIGIVKLRAQESISEVPTIMSKPKIDVAAENRQLQRTLLLDAAQFVKIQAVNEERHEALEAIEQMYRYDPKKEDKIYELELQYDEEFAAILTKNQQKEYLQLRGRSAPREFVAADTLKAPTFNEQIHAIIEKATAPVIDSALIAKQDSASFEKLTSDEQSRLEGIEIAEVTELVIQMPDTANNNKLAIQISDSTIQNNLAIQKADTSNWNKLATQIPDTTNPDNLAIVTPQKEKETEFVPDVPEKDESHADKLVVQTSNVTEETDPIVPKLSASDGECKTCYAVEPTDSLYKKSEPISWEAEPDKIAAEEALPEPGAEQQAGAGNDENFLKLPADEVNKLKTAVFDKPGNGTELEEKTEDFKIEPAESLLPTKQIAGEIEP